MRARIVLAGCLAAALLWASPARADDDDDAPEEKVEAVVETGDSRAGVQPAEGGPAKVGLLHDTLRRAKKQPTLLQKISDEYPDFKKRMEDEHGLTWSFSLSYRQRWVHPDNIGTSSQTLFWPTLNWDIFDSKTFGSGSFQFFYYGERLSGSKVTASRGARTLSGELPDYQDRYSQITYTHTLPGEKLAVAVGQYSFFNFDSSEFMANQQLNFVNNIFSGEWLGNLPDDRHRRLRSDQRHEDLQLIAGGQSVNVEDPSKRPTDGFLSSPYAWLGYVQWTPAFKGLGDAQYSLTLYQAPAVTERPASRGWSINAVQHLNDQWAVFGRLNASNDDSGGHKRSFGNRRRTQQPAGSRRADQIGIAFGSLEQKLPLPLLTLEHTQNTLEAYWNWSLIGGLLLTPDVQYIRNPAFAPDRDSAWISSLRTTLVF